MWKLLSGEQVAYLVGKYPFVKDGDKLGSQYLLPWSDYVAGDFSTLAVQALFFDTQVVSVRRDLMNCPVESLRLNPLADILTTLDPSKRTKMLYWLLSRYAVPEARLFDGAWLSRFISRSVEALKSKQPWEAYAEPVTTIEDWAESKWRTVPNASLSYCQAQLFFAVLVEGNPQGFSEYHSFQISYPISAQRQTLQLRIPENVPRIYNLRLDLADQPLAIRLHSLSLVSSGGASLWQWDGKLAAFRNFLGLVFCEESENVLCVCLTNDPQFEINLPERVLSLTTSGTYFCVEITVLTSVP
jgi:hypothetical protein